MSEKPAFNATIEHVEDSTYKLELSIEIGDNDKEFREIKQNLTSALNSLPPDMISQKDLGVVDIEGNHLVIKYTGSQSECMGFVLTTALEASGVGQTTLAESVGFIMLGSSLMDSILKPSSVKKWKDNPNTAMYG